MPRILIADDNQPNAELLEAHLDGQGYETRIAANGEDTLKAARESITLQEHGIGGRRRLGCGIFVPLKERPR